MSCAKVMTLRFYRSGRPLVLAVRKLKQSHDLRRGERVEQDMWHLSLSHRRPTPCAFKITLMQCSLQIVHAWAGMKGAANAVT